MNFVFCFIASSLASSSASTSNTDNTAITLAQLVGRETVTRPKNWTTWSAVLGFQIAENFHNVFSTPFDVSALIDGMKGFTIMIIIILLYCIS